MARRSRDPSRVKVLLAQECARLMAEEGMQDFRATKRKAALRLRISDKAVFPDNAEIEQALIEHQRLFHTGHEANLRRLRQTALEAMHFLTPFRPRLVGAVLNGTANPYTAIQIHLFADTPTDVLLFLMEYHIPVETSECHLRLNNGEQLRLPVFRFGMGDTPVDLTVFALLAEREAPRSPIDGRPLRRANLAEVQTLLGPDQS